VRELGGLFPEGVVVEVATPEMWEGPLYPEEEVSIRNAVRKRRREFAAGRNCARRALAFLGVQDCALPMGNDREVLWPEGIVGSISHCDDLCAVAVARRDFAAGIGLDVERAGGADAHGGDVVATFEQFNDRAKSRASFLEAEI